MKLIKRDGFDKIPLTKKPCETVSMFKYGEDAREVVRIVAEKKERKRGRKMKTKDMKSVVEFYIPLSWCSSLSDHKRMNEEYREIVQENSEKDWSKETSESVEMFLEKFEKSTMFVSTYVKAEKFFIRNVLDVLKGEETK